MFAPPVEATRQCAPEVAGTEGGFVSEIEACGHRAPYFKELKTHSGIFCQHYSMVW